MCPGGPDHHDLQTGEKPARSVTDVGAVLASGEPALRCAAAAAAGHHLCSRPGSVLWIPLRSEVTIIFTAKRS